MVCREFAKITGISDEAADFLKQWRNQSATITAHTSGSTGTPKAIELLKSDMALSARATNRYFGINRTSTLLLPLSPSYIAGKMMLVRAEEARCSIVMEKPSNAPLIRDYGMIDLMAVVPSQCCALLNNQLASKRVKNLIVGGAPLNHELELALTAMPYNSFATYGMTETCSHVALRKLGQPHYTAMPGITFSTDSRECLVIEAPRFSFKKLVTNDIVELVDSCTFRWVGRADNIINSGGIKLYPEELEKKLTAQLPMPFYIDGVEHPTWGTSVRITVESNGTVTQEDIDRICHDNLPSHACPKTIRIVHKIPRTTSGKLLRDNGV